MRNPKMTKKSLNVAAGLLAVAAITAAGASAASAEENYGDNDVEVAVSIPQTDTPGVLAMTVAADSTTLTENGSDTLHRRFTGSLPDVTVTDTRDASEIPAGAAWYVLGTASDFVGDAGQPTISAENLGWIPRLVDYDGSGEAFEGMPVDGMADGGPGLIDGELLVSSTDSASVSSEGSWTASADLKLTTDSGVVPGDYASTITLSLFE